MTRKEIEEVILANKGGLFNMEYDDGDSIPFSFHTSHLSNDNSYSAMEVNNIWKALVKPYYGDEWEQVIKGKDIVRISIDYSW